MYQSLTSIKRVMCLHIPRFASVVSNIGEAEPRALVEQQRQMMIVHSINRAAQDAGISSGMALSDARAFAPKLKTSTLDPPRVQNAAQRLALWLGRYSPFVGHEPLGNPLKTGGSIGFWIDISGAAHLFGGERKLMADLAKRLDTMGFSDNLMAIAPTPGAAWAVTHYSGFSQSVVAKADVRTALYPLAPAALRLDNKTLESLDRLGLRQISDIVKLPRAELGQRFARQADSLLLRLDQAFGETAESIEPLLPPTPYACRRLYPDPVQHKQAVIEGMRAGLNVVVKALERDQRGARHINLRLFRVDGHCHVISVKTNSPSRDVSGLIRLFDDRLEGIDVGFGLDALVVDISRHDPLAYEQTSLLVRTNRTTKGRVFDRIANRLGMHSVRQFKAIPSHTPGHDICLRPLSDSSVDASHLQSTGWQRAYRDRLLVGLDQDAPAADQGRAAVRNGKVLDPAQVKSSPPPLMGTPPRPIHLFARPEPVALQRKGRHTAQMTWRRVRHQLVHLGGPERVTADWWKPHIVSDPAQNTPRDYYRAIDTEGRRFYLFEALGEDHANTGQWHVAGLM